MATPKKDLMAAMRKKRRDQGLVPLTVWVTQEQRKYIENYLREDSPNENKRRTI